jgi:acyl carrier protein
VNDSKSEVLAAEIGEHWIELLDCDTVSPDDYFLDLGGDSLLATILLNRIEDNFGYRPCIDFIFEHPFSIIVDDVKSKSAAHVGFCTILDHKI